MNLRKSRNGTYYDREKGLKVVESRVGVCVWGGGRGDSRMPGMRSDVEFPS